MTQDSRWNTLLLRRQKSIDVCIRSQKNCLVLIFSLTFLNNSYLKKSDLQNSKCHKLMDNKPIAELSTYVRNY